MWTVTDRGFLRGLRITVDDPPPPLPRFQVETAAVEGEYQVIDTLRTLPNPFFPTHVFAAHPLARAFAEQQADEMNADHERCSNDGA